MPSIRKFVCAALPILLCGTAAFAAEAVPAYVTDAVNDPGRPAWELARDKVHHPDAVLAFSGVKPGMVVAEMLPEAGYYTRLLSKLAGSRGTVYAVVPFAD